MKTSKRVYQQAKHYRDIYRRELLQMGHKPYYVERILRASEDSVKKFFARLVDMGELPNTEYSKVEAFFVMYQNDQRCIEVWKKKRQDYGYNLTKPVPEESDMEIFAQSLTLPDLYFVTTDSHFGILSDELEAKFGSAIVSYENANERLRTWGWQ